MKNCRMCKAEIAPSAKTCPSCGAEKPVHSDYALQSIGVAVLAAAIAYGVGKVWWDGDLEGWGWGVLTAFLGMLSVYGIVLAITGKDTD